MTSCTVEMKVFTDTIGRKPLYRVPIPSFVSCFDQVWYILFSNIFLTKWENPLKTLISAFEDKIEFNGMYIVVGCSVFPQSS
jgi:hypothetical protein